METYILIIFSVIITEAITELLTKSEFFKPVRAWFFNRRKNKLFRFIHDLLDCGYCTSVWVAFFVSLVLIDLSVMCGNVGWFVAWIVTHRLSNISHFVIDRVRGLDYSQGKGPN